MSIILITGSAGLIGSEAVEYYVGGGYDVIGIDNNMRSTFFGEEGSTIWNKERLITKFDKKYTHYDVDIREYHEVEKIFKTYNSDIKLIIHTAAQPSHDWAINDPLMDFTVNANGTLNLLEAFRKYCPDSVFILTSTNKVYGDLPNKLPFQEQPTRWEIDENHEFKNGISENMSVDQCMHSLFGASKLAGDILVQEYGKYFNLCTYSLRGGVLSGSKQSGVKLHGFLNYLMKCNMTNTPYTIIGYKGKQVRDIINSSDVISIMDTIYRNPRKGGEVYNIGGGRESNVSVLEAINLSEEITGNKMVIQYSDQNRLGDHIWYITDLGKLQSHYPNWKLNYNVKAIMENIYAENKIRWTQ